MKLTTFSVPKISDRPAATRNSSMPLMSPPVVCVTRQEADAKHASIACRSNIYSESKRAHRSPQRERAPRRIYPALVLRVTHRLLPLGFVFEDRLPVARRDVRHVRLF